MLQGVDWQLVTDVLGQPLSPFFNVQAVYLLTHFITTQNRKYLIYTGGNHTFLKLKRYEK